MKINQISIEEALLSLRSTREGLGVEESRKRLAEYGPNEVEEIKGEPLPLFFFKEFTHFFALILWLASILAFIAHLRDPTQGMLTFSLAIIVVILINGLFSFAQEYRAQKAIIALRKLLPRTVKTLREGKTALIPAANIVPGDLILLEEGDDIPADCRLVESCGLRVNNATITGESVSLSKNSASGSEEDLIHANNVLLAGTTVVSGNAKALVFATAMHTEFGKIAHLTQTAREPVSPLQKEIRRLSRIIAAIACFFGVFFFAIGQYIGFPFWGNLLFAIGIIVALVPEGLLPTVTLSLAMATQRMAKRNALIRHLPAIEALGATTVICTDKTGTLTQNLMSVKQIFLPQGFVEAENLSEEKIFEIARHCHGLKEGVVEGKWLGDPTEIALVEMAIKKQAPLYPLLGEIPFDAERRRMSTIHQAPEGKILYCKGALEALIPLCIIDAKEKTRWLEAQEIMAGKGLRVLALSHRILPEKCDPSQMESELKLAGLVGLEDPPRPEVKGAIRCCREAGIKVIMVTGDHPHTARAIGREIGLIETENPSVITGDTLRHLSSIQLRIALDSPEIIFARVSADQKMKIVKALKQKKETVAVTGDGVNDAPALKSADIGISMGKNGTDVARESSDMILLDDNFASIVAAIEEGRAVFENIKKFLTYILASNIPELVPYIAFVLFKIPLPLSIIQILSIDLGSDILPALALGAEKPDPGTMKKPPRRRTEKLLEFNLMLRAYVFLGALESVAAMATFFFVLKTSGNWQYGQIPSPREPYYLEATTACLCAIVILQIVNIFNCRSPEKSVFSRSLIDNHFIFWGISCNILLLSAIVYTPWGNIVFGTSPIGFEIWLFIAPFAVFFLLLEEIRKWGARSLSREGRKFWH